MGRPKTLTDSARKKLKRARDKILIPIYLGDQYERWTKKKQEQSETRFPESVALLNILTWNYVLSILNLKEVLYKSLVYVSLGRLFYKDLFYLFSNLCSSFSFKTMCCKYSDSLISGKSFKLKYFYVQINAPRLAKTSACELFTFFIDTYNSLKTKWIEIVITRIYIVYPLLLLSFSKFYWAVQSSCAEIRKFKRDITPLNIIEKIFQ